jgi:hypothetical protein
MEAEIDIGRVVKKGYNCIDCLEIKKETFHLIKSTKKKSNKSFSWGIKKAASLLVGRIKKVIIFGWKNKEGDIVRVVK